VAAGIENAIMCRKGGEVRMTGVKSKVSELLARLEHMSALYLDQVVPDLRNPIDLDLFNTYRSYLFPDYYPVSVKCHSDSRGNLFEAVRSFSGGQIFFSNTHPGITRGNHYHNRKVERFLVVEGDALIRVRKLFSGNVSEFRVSGRVPQFVDIPTLHTHSISNIGDSNLATLFWAHEIFDPNDSDTYPEPVVFT
jgi:UDP-2-acetamido-2,6-beta-L-arabino-hexul-4-ose reductase